MLFWVLGFLLLFIALLIPILAIVLDSPLARNLFRGSDPSKLTQLMERMEAMEEEVAELRQSLETLRDETRFVQRLLKNPDDVDTPKQLSPPDA